MTDKAIAWSLTSWQKRHEAGYFPNSDQHKDWRVYNEPPDWLMELAEPHAGDNVLEVGCGYGEWMIPLSAHVKSVEGVDIHPSLAHVSREKFRERNIANCAVVVNDGLTIPYPARHFSLVYSISVFQHLPRSIVRGYLREIARVVKADGRVALHFRNADNVGPYPPLATDIEENHKGDFSVGWTADQVVAAGREAGLVGRVVDIGLFLVLVGRYEP
jgi:SAM-dependent methyltransferase